MIPTEGMRAALKSSPTLAAFLTTEYLARRERNARYSHRAFARDLDLSISHLSEVLHGNSGVSKEMLARIAVALKLDDIETEYLWHLTQRQFSKVTSVVAHADDRLETILRTAAVVRMPHSNPSKPLEWFDFAVFEMIRAGFDVERMKTLTDSLKPGQFEASIDRLIEVQLVTRDGDGFKVHQPQIFFEGFTGWPKHLHQEVLRTAVEALERPPRGENYVATNLNAVSSEQLPAARQRIRDFVAAFNEEFGTSPKSDSIFVFSTQFFNLF